MEAAGQAKNAVNSYWLKRLENVSHSNQRVQISPTTQSSRTSLAQKDYSAESEPRRDNQGEDGDGGDKKAPSTAMVKLKGKARVVGKIAAMSNFSQKIVSRSIIFPHFVTQ